MPTLTEVSPAGDPEALSRLRLVVYVNTRLASSGSTVRVAEPHVGFWIDVARRVTSVTLVGLEAGGGRELGVSFEAPPSLRVLALPGYDDSLVLLRRWPMLCRESWRRSRSEIGQCDVLIASAPNPIGLWLGRRARRAGTVVAYLVRGDHRRTVAHEYGSRPGRGLWRLLARILNSLAEREMRRSFAFALGDELCTALRKRGVEASTLSLHVDLPPPGGGVPSEMLGPEPLVLAVSRLSREKGIDVLLRALAATESHCRCGIAGDGPERSRLEGLAGELGLQDRVTFLGFVPFGERLSALYDRADLVALPSRTEGLPSVLLEAMAAGSAIVASSVGGIGQMLRHEKEGLLVPPDSPAALASAFDLLLTDPDRRQALAEAARRRARERRGLDGVEFLLERLQEEFPSDRRRQNRSST